MRAGDRSGPRLRPDPAPACHFRVEIDGVARASFLECRGLDTRTEVIEVHEGGAGRGSTKLPGHCFFAPLTLVRGITHDRELWRWRRRVIDGDPAAARDGDVVIVDPTGEEIGRWTFRRGWPSRWQGPILSAAAIGLAVESIEIVHEGLLLVGEDTPEAGNEAAP